MRFRIFWSMVFGLLSIPFWAQPAFPAGHLYYRAKGTGQTTGHIATLDVYNPSPLPLRTTVGDCFIPSGQDYQGYVVLKTYPIEIPPFGKRQVQLEGYCTNVARPAVPEGESMTGVTEWVPWASGDPLPAPGARPGFGFTPQVAAPIDDPLGLSYPGTQAPFPYRIDFNRYPQQAARLLLYAAYAAEQAFDQLIGAGKIQPNRLNRSIQALRQDLVQQALWAYTARLEGSRYHQPEFTRQFTEEMEQQLNQEQNNFPPETKQQAERQTQDLWSGISLVGVSAKLIAVHSEHPQDIFQEIPTGPAAQPMQLLQQLIETTDPKQANADQYLLPALLFLQKNPIATDQSILFQNAQTKWAAYLNSRLEQVQPGDTDALPALLDLAGWLDGATDLLPPGNQRDQLFANWTAKINSHIEQQVLALQNTDPSYLQKWRTMTAWRNTRWYSHYCQRANPLKKLPPVAQTGKHGASFFKPASISLSGPQWKQVFLPIATAQTKKFPWWIPAAGVPVAGGVVYLLLRENKGKDKLPTAPVATPDALTLPCKGAGAVQALNNDSGSGITITAVNSVAGLQTSIAGGSAIQVQSSGTGIFTFSYMISDQAGQTALGTVTVTVIDQTAPSIICPTALTLEDCDLPPSPDVAGYPVVSDDCDAAPTLNFMDEISGTPCARTFNRKWIATDASGKSAVCTQLIATTDQTPPQFSFCPPQITVPFSQAIDLSITGQATATDHCAATIQVDFTDDNSSISACNGHIIRTWTAQDLCQNTAHCTQTIQVFDNIAPDFIICPGPVSVSCEQLTNVTITGVAKAQDDCSSGTSNLVYLDDLSGYNGCSGLVVRNWRATDASGNSSFCTQVITVTDSQPPVFTTCPAAVTVDFGQQNNIFITGMAVAADLCTAAVNSVFTDDLSGFSDCGGLILRKWTATDDCNNTGFCEQSITVSDIDAPVFTTCPAAVTVDCGQQQNLDLTGKAEAKDDCAGPLSPTFSDNPASFSGCAGTILRTWVATDPGGNTASCTQTISVVDQQGPVFTNCPGPVTVACGKQNDLNLTGMAVATDSCNGASSPVFKDDLSGFSGCQGNIFRTWTSMDSCSNTASCLQTITVFDDIPPMFTNCPQGIFVTCGQESNLNITGQAAATDSCSGTATISYTDDLSQFSNCEGLVLRNWIAADLCGNTILCQQAITVVAMPCGFTPNFSANAATCGNCNGSTTVSVIPAGQYSFQWSNGQNGPMAINLCPQIYSVSIHDQINFCTEIFFVTVPESPGLILTVLEIVPPSSPSADDGQVTVQVQPFNAPLPLEVFVDGVSIGFSGNYTFDIINFPAGIYEIQVIDASGCPSDVVTVELFPGGPAPVVVAGPMEYNQRAPSLWLQSFEQKVSAQLSDLAAPEQVLQSRIFWSQSFGIELQFRIGKDWQLNWADSRQQGLQWIGTPTAPGQSWQLPVQMSRQALGLRHFTGHRKSMQFFQDAGLAHLKLRSDLAWPTTSQNNFPLHVSSEQWQVCLGGGLRHFVWKEIALEWGGQVQLSATENGFSLWPAFQLQLKTVR